MKPENIGGNYLRYLARADVTKAHAIVHIE